MKRIEECSTDVTEASPLDDHIARTRRTVEALCELYGFSAAEAADFAAMFPSESGNWPKIGDDCGQSGGGA